jgi:hypothetical protein
VLGRFTSAVGLAAGDRVQRTVEVKTGRRTRIHLVVAGRGASPLIDRTVGLRLSADRCSKAWRRVGAAYTCRGKTLRVLADDPAVGRHALRKLAARGTNHLRLTLVLPQSAPNALQGQSALLTYRFKP